MSKLLLLDLFSGAGGGAEGYARAGFEVVGVDNVPQPRYPFRHIVADALEYAAAHGHEYDVIHASPPCQRYSVITPDPSRHPDLLPVVRNLLQRIGKPWVIENVPRAPMRADFKLCGCMFDLPHLKRERWFETSWQGFALRPSCVHLDGVYSIVGNGTPTGNRNALGRNIYEWERKAAMGIDWMTRKELAQAIPPAYTTYIGRQLLAAITNAEVMV